MGVEDSGINIAGVMSSLWLVGNPMPFAMSLGSIKVRFLGLGAKLAELRLRAIGDSESDGLLAPGAARFYRHETEVFNPDGDEKMRIAALLAAALEERGRFFVHVDVEVEEALFFLQGQAFSLNVQMRCMIPLWFRRGYGSRQGSFTEPFGYFLQSALWDGIYWQWYSQQFPCDPQLMIFSGSLATALQVAIKGMLWAVSIWVAVIFYAAYRLSTETRRDLRRQRAMDLINATWEFATQIGRSFRQSTRSNRSRDRDRSYTAASELALWNRKSPRSGRDSRLSTAEGEEDCCQTPSTSIRGTPSVHFGHELDDV
mmetsp:Transcript_19866/g.50542  ORF Transcript_19866/g.50542 Transcript_19866/m.50542 type:complete len:314 (+) Transcript_19866:730-1671(+)